MLIICFIVIRDNRATYAPENMIPQQICEIIFFAYDWHISERRTKGWNVIDETNMEFILLAFVIKLLFGRRFRPIMLSV